MARYGMVIDLKKCVGCNACSIACKQLNGLPRQALRTCVKTEEVGTYPNPGYVLKPMICMQCDNPACVAACPTGASIKGEDGVVYIQKDICIGCQSCIQACPYGARTYLEMPEPLFGGESTAWDEIQLDGDFPDMTVDKCNFCQSRRARGEEPACVATCPASARIFGDLDDENSAVSVYIREHEAYRDQEELGTEPKVYFVK